jgi:soluble lytic murein transglycosylase-like protein
MIKNILVLLCKGLFLVALIIGIIHEVRECEKSFSSFDLNKMVVYKKDPVEAALTHLGAPKGKVKELAHATKLTSKEVGVPPLLLCALMKTESEFQYNAKSPKNYKGLMQTPSFSGFATVDMLHGGMILKQKLKEEGGDIEDALAAYKGGKNIQQARNQANQVIKLYHELNKKFKEEG